MAAAVHQGVWDLDDEQAEVFRRRYREARRAGLIPEDALEFAAGDGDVGELRRLADAGCPPEQLARIVL